MIRKFGSLLVGALLAGSMPALALKAPDTWDGLNKVQAKRVAAAYVLPGANFGTYTKVMLDPTEAAFQQDWLRDYNRSAKLGGRISDKDAQEGLQLVQSGFHNIFAEEFAKAGYQVVTDPGPDVLRLRTGVLDLTVAAPDVGSSAFTRSFAVEAGEATLFIEARDSVSGALLGRAVDRQAAGEYSGVSRTRASNQADFEFLFKSWAKVAVKGLEELKSAPAAR